jgi:replication-associated recombination protein RarA
MIYRHLAAALALFAFDAFAMGECVLASLVAIVMIPIGLSRPRHGARVAAVYFAMLVAAVAVALGNQQIARARAERIVAALQAYKAAHGAFPERLTDLVPAYLPAVPRARCVLAFGEFHYSHDDDDDDGTLWFTAVSPFGRRLYRLQTASWMYME